MRVHRLYIIVFFFFSSRRRHTRCSRDWSSDVCSSDLKAVRAQTMFGDSYVYVVFEDGTDIYWARARVLEYMQQIQGRLPEAVHPTIGPDATGAGWAYEYLVIDKSHAHSLADLRSLQDWYLRYQ